MMNATDHERAFDAAVRARMQDDTWNLRIARGVMRKRRRRKLAAAAAAAASLAAAASVAFVLTTATLTGSPEGAALNSFVNAQVEGTWQNVYSYSDAGSGEVVFAGAEADESLDAVIDGALERRL